MQIPQRRSQSLQIREDDGPVYLTPEAIETMKRTMERLEKIERPKTVEDLQDALKKGDLSENAEYQDAKAKLARIDGRLFGMKEKLKRAIAIQEGHTDDVRIGSTVDVRVEGKDRTYRIVGPTEASPTEGRISFQSPLGSALLRHKAGQVVAVETERGKVWYEILTIR